VVNSKKCRSIVLSFWEKIQKYDIFLKSRGYYLEWLRKEWLKEKDINQLKKNGTATSPLCPVPTGIHTP